MDVLTPYDGVDRQGRSPADWGIRRGVPAVRELNQSTGVGLGFRPTRSNVWRSEMIRFRYDLKRAGLRWSHPTRFRFLF
ncbi:hypothetical protein AB395_00004725 (plasmid) [Sinorhizobium fredii CCBAU 45436]|nr:hypothetical protein AB395_00004725 [Sinorhizobium fredii CCBAU 45436]